MMDITVEDRVTGEFASIRFRKMQNKHYAVMLGDRTIGEAFGPNGFEAWTAISHAQPPWLQGLRMVRGLKTKYYVVDYLFAVGLETTFHVREKEEKDEQTRRFEQLYQELLAKKATDGSLPVHNDR